MVVRTRILSYQSIHVSKARSLLVTNAVANALASYLYNLKNTVFGWPRIGQGAMSRLGIRSTCHQHAMAVLKFQYCNTQELQVRVMEGIVQLTPTLEFSPDCGAL